jgi:hypothetical protein
MTQPFDPANLKSISINLLAATAVAAIFVIAYILSRISPETRRTVRIMRLHPATSGVDNRQDDVVNAEATQFCEAMQSADPDDLVKNGRKYRAPSPYPPQKTCFASPPPPTCFALWR